MSTHSDRTRTLLGNTTVLVLVQVTSMALSFVLTPYIVGRLGLERFGLWAFLGSVVAYAGLLQVGLGRGTVRFVAVYAGRGELDVVRRIVSYSAAWHVAAGLALTPVCWVGAREIVPLLHLSQNLVGTAEVLFPLVIAYFFLSGAVRPLAGLITGLERMWLVSVITLGSQILYAIAVIVLLSSGAGLYGLLAAAFAQTAVQAVAYHAIARRLIGRVFANPFSLDRAVLRSMLRFGGWVQLTGMTALVNREADAIVIGSWIDLTSVGVYDIGNRLAGLVRTVPLALLGPLLPTATSIHATGDERRVARTVLQASRLLGLLTITASGFLLATAPLALRVWLGRSYPHTTTIVVLLVAAYAVNNLTGVGTTVLSAIGRPDYETEYAALGVVLNIAATLSLAPFYGLYGVVVGTVIGVVLSSVYFLWRFHRVLQLSAWQYLGRWLWRLLAAASPGFGAVLALRQAAPAGIEAHRGSGALLLAGLAVVYLAVLVLGLRVFRFLDARDLDTVRRALPRRLRPIASSPAIELLFGARS